MSKWRTLVNRFALRSHRRMAEYVVRASSFGVPPPWCVDSVQFAEGQRVRPGSLLVYVIGNSGAKPVGALAMTGDYFAASDTVISTVSGVVRHIWVNDGDMLDSYRALDGPSRSLGFL